MKALTFIGLCLAGVSLSILSACSNSTPTATAPSASSSASMASADHTGMSHGKKININNALLSQLDKLEAKLGIPALSNKIQSSRPYAKPEELVSKNVINQAQFDQIKDMVTIEEIALTGEAKDIDYMLKLGLMKGHMYVAKELLDLGKPDQAEPHIGHPVEEIYADVEDQLNERGVKEFKTPLMALQELVKAGAKDKAKVDAEFDTSMKAIDGAIAVLPDAQRKSPEFVIQVMNGLLDTANSEYGAAIADGKIKEAIEYQDSRGFVEYSNELYKGISSQIAAKSPDTEKKISTTLKELTLNWPTPGPPAAPVKTTQEVSKLIKEIETSGQSIK
jgi:Spy/CpxP family protein refolding chaperone